MGDKGGGSPRALRVAFYGRVARNDDNSQVMVKHQLAVAKTIFPDGHAITGYFADVAPWNGLNGSNRSTALWRLDGQRVAGGLIEMLDRARSPEPEFDAVACADRDRLSLRLADLVRIEGILSRCGIQVLTPTGIWLLSSDTAEAGLIRAVLRDATDTRPLRRRRSR